MNRRIKKYCTFLTAMLFAVSFCGCGRAKVTDMPTGQNPDQVQSQPIVEDMNGIPEELVYTISSSEVSGLYSQGKSIIVNASVESTGYERANVYSLTYKEINDDYIRELADKFFDGGTYELERPYELYSEEELEQEMKTLGAEIEGNGTSEKVHWDRWRVELALDEYEAGAVKEMEEGQLILYGHDNINTSGYDPTPYDYAYCTLDGSIDGESWMLWYMDDYFQTRQLVLGREDILTGQLVHQYIDIDNTASLTALYGGTNPCSLEEAEEAANAFLKRFGYTDMSMVETNHRAIRRGAGNDISVNGYLFVFTRSMDELSGAFCMNDSAIIAESEGDEAYQEYILVEVGTGGVEKVTFGASYVIGEKLSDGTKMLSFEQIDGVARYYMTNNLDEIVAQKGYSTNKDINISEIKLCYLVLRYEDQYRFVPAWVFYYNKDLSGGSYKSRIAVFAINAIDGSIISMPYSKFIY